MTAKISPCSRNDTDLHLEEEAITDAVSCSMLSREEQEAKLDNPLTQQSLSLRMTGNGSEGSTTETNAP